MPHGRLAPHNHRPQGRATGRLVGGWHAVVDRQLDGHAGAGGAGSRHAVDQRRVAHALRQLPAEWSAGRDQADALETGAETTAGGGRREDGSVKSNLVDLTVRVHYRTEKAILVSDDGDRENAKWLPLSQIEVEEVDASTAIVTLPEWLAVEKGLV